MRAIARARVRDAQALLSARRFDGAYYLAGYAIELALKARICRTLRWAGFPETSKEFTGLQSLRTHDLEILLRFSGVEAPIQATRKKEWSVVVKWNPEKRYQPMGQSAAQEATDMVTSVIKVLEVL
jgi:hypothetical protein